jgi:phosphatidylglycerophosphate synthase
VVLEEADGVTSEVSVATEPNGIVVERPFRDVLRQVRDAQKPGLGVPAYTRWMNRRAARPVAVLAYILHVSPNAITMVSALLSFTGLALLVGLAPRPFVGLAVAAFLAVGYVFDSADGQLARLAHRGGPSGEWLDHVVDAIRAPAIHLAVLIALHNVPTVGSWPLAVAIAYTLLSGGQFTSQLLAEKLSGQSKPATVARGNLQSMVLLPTDTGVLCWLFILWGWPAVFVLAYAALFAANLVHSAVSARRKFRRLRALEQLETIASTGS